MNGDPKELIRRHLNDCISPEDQCELAEWLKKDEHHLRQFINAVLLDDRLNLHFRTVSATTSAVYEPVISTLPADRQRVHWRVLVCAVLAAILGTGAALQLLKSPPGSDSTTKAITKFHELVIRGRETGDRTYRVSFVKDRNNQNGNPGLIQPDDSARLPVHAVTGREAMLYVRDGHQFVYTWEGTDGGRYTIGSNGQLSWAIRPGAPAQTGDPLYFTGGLPAGLYLSPILSFFDGQEKMISSDYDIEIRAQDDKTLLFIAMKKPDSRQGPRRIELRFSESTRVVSEMRIWPATPDHRRTDHTLVQLISDQRLPENFFSHEIHDHQNSAEFSRSRLSHRLVHQVRRHYKRTLQTSHATGVHDI